MKLNRARKKIHEMRTSLNVVNNFVVNFAPSDEDESQFREATIISMKKLNDAIETLSEMVHADIEKRRLNGQQVLK